MEEDMWTREVSEVKTRTGLAGSKRHDRVAAVLCVYIVFQLDRNEMTA